MCLRETLYQRDNLLRSLRYRFSASLLNVSAEDQCRVFFRRVIQRLSVIFYTKYKVSFYGILESLLQRNLLQTLFLQVSCALINFIMIFLFFDQKRVFFAGYSAYCTTCSYTHSVPVQWPSPYIFKQNHFLSNRPTTFRLTHLGVEWFFILLLILEYRTDFYHPSTSLLCGQKFISLMWQKE